MRIARVHIENFRSILDQVIELDRLTVVVGPNGAGKSAVLRAIDAFYEPSFRAAPDDFYNRKTENPIRIAVTYTDLTSEERAEYGKHVVEDGTLTVTRVLTTATNSYHGARKQHPAFRVIRESKNKTERKNAYNELRQQEGYNELVAVRAADEVDALLEAWETANADRCEMMEDDGQFFGFQNVGRGKLERFTRFLLIPAVREADRDATDAKGSAINQLLELVVRNTLAQSDELRIFREATQAKYSELVDPAHVPQLKVLERELSEQLHNFVPSANVLLEWMGADQLQLPLPKAAVQLEEDGFKAPVGRVGHGLQRAFILSLLQRLAAGTSTTTRNPDDGEPTSPTRLPNLILAIEEPELYQHPNRQRQMARVLRQLSEGRVAGVADKTHVLYCTHSPLFVELGSFDRVRRLSKTQHPEWDANDAAKRTLPRITKTAAATLQGVADELYNVQDPKPQQRYTGDSVRARMTTLMTPWMNEGFFADVIVLVEGEGDRAAILGTAAHLRRDFESAGVAVIPCEGKASIDRPLLAFRALGIPVYVIFDGDCNCDQKDRASTIKANKDLQRLLAVANPADFPATAITENYSVLQDMLEPLLRAEATPEVFDKALAAFTAENGYRGAHQALKSPVFVSQVLSVAPQAAIQAGTFARIVDRIWALAQNRHAQLAAPQGTENGT